MSPFTTTTPLYPGLAYDDVLANMGGNKSLLAKLALLFVEQHAADITLINAALAAENWDLALHLTHALRGTAANLGATTLHDAAHTLETVLCIRETTPETAPATMEIAMAELLPSLQLLAQDLSDG